VPYELEREKKRRERCPTMQATTERRRRNEEAGNVERKDL